MRFQLHHLYPCQVSPHNQKRKPWLEMEFHPKTLPLADKGSEFKAKERQIIEP